MNGEASVVGLKFNLVVQIMRNGNVPNVINFVNMNILARILPRLKRESVSHKNLMSTKNMKIEAFINMATKLKEQKPIYASCICSPKTYQMIKKFGPHGKMFLGIMICEESYFPDDRVWCLDEDYTKIYREKGLAGLIAHIADINLLPIFEGMK